MTENKPKRRWFRFSIRDLLLITAIIALMARWWIDHRRLVALIPPPPPSLPSPPTYLVELNLSRDDQIASLQRTLSKLESSYAAAIGQNDAKAAAALKIQVDQVKKKLDSRRDALRPAIIKHLASEMGHSNF
jgi:hypothetical protein